MSVDAQGWSSEVLVVTEVELMKGQVWCKGVWSDPFRSAESFGKSSTWLECVGGTPVPGQHVTVSVVSASRDRFGEKRYERKVYL